MFANEAVHGGRFVTRKDRAHMLAVTLDKVKVFETWMAAGKMDPVDPIHLFILLWASTQYYADFDVLAKNHLERPKLGAADFDHAAETITAIVLKGCGIAQPRAAGQRAVRSAARLRG